MCIIQIESGRIMRTYRSIDEEGAGVQMPGLNYSEPCEKEVTTVLPGRSWWMRVTGVICDRRIAERIKGKVDRKVSEISLVWWQS